MNRMKGEKCWGQSLHIDLNGCNVKIFSKINLAKFCTELCKAIKMKKYKNTFIERFGKGKLRGNSAMQFIETSSLSVHADEFGKRVFIDIFSCKNFDNRIARRFCKNFFEAKKMSSQCLYRK